MRKRETQWLTGGAEPNGGCQLKFAGVGGSKRSL